MTAIVYFIAVIIVLISGVPLFIVLSGLSLALFKYAAQLDTALIISELAKLSSSPVLPAIPLFTFAGYILSESRSPEKLVRLIRSLFGGGPGALAVVVLLTCSAFTALTGASGVTIIALGGLLYPALRKQKYSEKFSLGLLTTSGSLGLLFPPSLPLIIYGVVAKVDINTLFKAGLIPGALLVFTLSGFSLIKNRGVKISNNDQPEKTSLLKAIKEAKWDIPLPFLILAGIYGGFLTLVEVAGMTVLYVLITKTIITRETPFSKLIPVCIESMKMVGVVLVILACATGLTNFMVDQQVPMKLLKFIQATIHSRYLYLFILNIFLLAVGCFMDIFSALIVIVPLILPVAEGFGIHPVHLGIIFLTNLEIGYSTPPVGINLFISSFRFNKPLTFLYRSSLPFLIIMLIDLLLITYIPALSMLLV